jgi:hypothetical protein
MEERAASRLCPSDGRLCRLGEMFNMRDSHRAQRNEESPAYFLLVAIIDGD